MLLAAPTDLVALNFFFDTLLFCGAILKTGVRFAICDSPSLATVVLLNDLSQRFRIASLTPVWVLSFFTNLGVLPGVL